MTTTQLHDIVKRSSRLVDSSKKNYLADIDRWVAYAGGDSHKWTRYRAQEFYDHLIHVEGLKPQSATRILSSLRYAASLWAKLENKSELDFTSAVEFARAEKKQRRTAITYENAKKLLAETHATKPEPIALRDFALFVIALETGMRQMSLASMKLEHTGVDLAIDPLGFPTTDVIIKGRGADLYPVPLSDTAMLALLPWRRWLAKQKITTGYILRTVEYSPTARTYKIGAHLSHRTIYNITKRHADAAGIPHVHPHLFRHTFITWRLAAHVAPEQISAITLHRLEDDKLGQLYDYTDKEGVIARLARAHTPDWLAELVKEIVKP